MKMQALVICTARQIGIEMIRNRLVRLLWRLPSRNSARPAVVHIAPHFFS
jgi:hypothetical protein